MIMIMMDVDMLIIDDVLSPHTLKFTQIKCISMKVFLKSMFKVLGPSKEDGPKWAKMRFCYSSWLKV